MVSNPEFLREGSAVQDFMRPDRVAIGAESEQAVAIMKDIYSALYLNETPFVITSLETAEMIKYATNAFLATKVTFINEIANLCERVGADVHHVARAMGLDGRIGRKFLHPGPGYGGSCFPKDTRALSRLAQEKGYTFKVLNSVIEVNEEQKLRMVDKIEGKGGRTSRERRSGSWAFRLNRIRMISGNPPPSSSFKPFSRRGRGSRPTILQPWKKPGRFFRRSNWERMPTMWPRGAMPWSWRRNGINFDGLISNGSRGC